MRLACYVVLLCLLVSSCARSPITGKRELAISESKELELGKAYDPQIVASMGVYEDAGLQQLLDRAGMAMAKDSHRPNLPWTFRIVDSDVVNAFAVPGGYVYFTRGILAHFNNEAEFAGVLGHEIGHVTARHSAKQMRKQQLAQVGMVAGALASNVVAQNFQAINQGMQLLMLKYSRDAESESDALGVEYSTEQDYDAQYMANFFKTIARIRDQSGAEVPSFLSTHPDPLNREQRVKALASEWQAKLPGEENRVNRDGYLALLEGLVYGEDPKQGFVENGKFYHPVLKFVFDVPRGWTLANSPQQVQMGAPANDAVVSFTLAQGASPEAAARAWLQQNQLQAQRGGATQINGFQAYVVEGITAPSQQQQQLAFVATFIQDGSNMYNFTGISLAQAARKYSNVLTAPAASYKTLTDPTYLNRQPERIEIATVPSSQTLAQFLTSRRIPTSRHTEFAILNGLELNATLRAGKKVKVVDRVN